MKYQYLFGWEINLNDEEKFRDFVNTHGIYEDEFNITTKTGLSSLELRYENDYLVQMNDIDELNNIEKELSEVSKGFKYFENEKNRINFLISSDQIQNSYLGEDESIPFIPPINNLILSPFQVIGKLSKDDEIFSWLPFDELYITYPLYTGIYDFLFLDYSNPLAPEVYGDNYKIEYPYGEIKNDGIHKFQRGNITTKSIKDIKNRYELDFEYWYYGITGIPIWIQYPAIPRCPKNGKLMKFLCQINTTEAIKLRETNLISNSKHFATYNKDLRFWGSGSLFVFLEPESKIVGLIIQDT